MNLKEEVALAMVSSLENYTSEVVDSVEFSCGKLSDDQKNEIADAVAAVIEDHADEVRI